MLKYVSTLLILLLTVGPALADPPLTFSVQGILKGSGGVPIADGTYAMTFQLYNAPTGGSTNYGFAENVLVQDGVFNVVVGQTKPLSLNQFDQEYWLGVTMPGESEMAPRIRLTGAPYAIEASTVRDDAITSSKIPDGTVVRSLNGLEDDVTIQGGSNVTVTQAGTQITISAVGGAGGDDGDWTVDGAHLHRDGTGVVSIGTDTPVPAWPNQTTLQVGSSIWPTIALDDIDASPIERWLIYHETIGVDLVFGYGTGSGNLGTPVLWATHDGNLGVGGINPGTTLDVLGGNGDLGAGAGDLRVGNTNHSLQVGVHTSGGSAGEVNLRAESPTGTPRLDLGSGDHDVLSVQDNSVEFFGDNGGVQIEMVGATGNDLGGNLHLYDAITSIPRIELDAHSGNTSDIYLRQSDNQQGVRLQSSDATGGNLTFYDSDGLQALSLHAEYSGMGSRVRTDILEITGGADLSEQFQINDNVDPAADGSEPGTVLCIDPDNPGELRPSSGAYDNRVAGVISGAGGVRPGMLMGQVGTLAHGDVPVALAGRVYVKADAQSGSIQPGDLLTTSSTAGHAMRVDDASRANGAILGKAMTALDSGTGLVLVLVSLQ